MSDRISDERIEGLAAGYESTPTRYEGRMMAEEIIQSRALVTELRALAERMRIERGSMLSESRHSEGEYDATTYWLASIESLLSAHGGLKTETKPYKFCPECGEHLSMHKIPCGSAHGSAQAEKSC